MQPETTDAPAEAPADAPPPDARATLTPAPFRPALRVRALGAGRLPHVNDKSVGSRRPRPVGRDDAGAPLRDGEWVHDLAFYRRAVRAGALEILEEVR